MPTSFMFWNLQRLGASTELEILTNIAMVAEAQKADVEGYCELTTACQVMTPYNLTYRKKNPYQLCYSTRQYAKIPNPLTFPIPTQVAITKIIPTTTPAYEQAQYNGGTYVKDLCDRAPGLVGGGALNNVNVYIFHPPAYSEGAERAVAFVACYLDAYYKKYQGYWLLIGDLNVEPADLALSKVGIPLKNYIICSGQPTHKKGKELDYALTNVPKNVIKLERVRTNKYFELSDHIPIVAKW